MNDGADHTTGVADAADATAIVSDGSSTEIAELAWSSEAETEEAAENAERTNWRWRLRWASLVALVCVMALATGWLSLALYREDFTHPIPNARPATVKSAPQPAPAPTPTKSVPIAPPPPARHEMPPTPAPQQPNAPDASRVDNPPVDLASSSPPAGWSQTQATSTTGRRC